MANIKFKQILKEAAWDRTAGKALPTLEDVQKAYDAKKHLQEELPIEEGPNTWRRMDELHNLKKMKAIRLNTAVIAREFYEEGFDRQDIRAWFDNELFKIIKAYS